MIPELISNVEDEVRGYFKTFFAPELGDMVKICVAVERFWVEIEEMNEDTFVGRVNNYLLRHEVHGLDYNDKVEFKKCHIYAV